MSASSDQPREMAPHQKSQKKLQKKQRTKKAIGVRPLKRQMDGSPVQSPPHDPVNSEETLRRNKVGNS